MLGAKSAACFVPKRKRCTSRQTISMFNLNLSYTMNLNNVISLSLPIIAEVENVSLHLFGQGFELAPKPGEDLPLASDNVGNMAVSAEIAHNDDGVVGENELLETISVSTVKDIGEDWIAVSSEGVLDDVSAGGVGGVVVGVVFHNVLCFVSITKITLFYFTCGSLAQSWLP